MHWREMYFLFQNFHSIERISIEGIAPSRRISGTDVINEIIVEGSPPAQIPPFNTISIPAESSAFLIPLAADRGVAIIVNRPFMNGAYFRRLEGRPLPPWAAEFGCKTWAQFSLKYILANPAITCVLTETSNPEHMEENASTALGTMPGESARKRMREFIDSVNV